MYFMITTKIRITSRGPISFIAFHVEVFTVVIASAASGLAVSFIGIDSCVLASSVIPREANSDITSRVLMVVFANAILSQ